MKFLDALAGQISSQFSLGENTNNTLDTIENGQNIKYGSLGDWAKNIDQSAERRYVEEGYLRRDPYNTSPKQFEILMQEPNASIFVKKRMFSSLAQNNRPDYMDEDERLYFKSIKILFNNKCNQIAALEKLSKIQKVSSILGQIDNQMIPLIITLSDVISNGFGEGSDFFGGFKGSAGGRGDLGKLADTVDTLRRLYAFNQPNLYTTWITDQTNFLQSQFGQGTGVIELTNFTNLSTNVSVELGGGKCNFNISDPYESMLITEYDIERAIADSTNAAYNKKIFQLGKDSVEQLINNLQNKLNQYRTDRGASPISFKINPDTLLGKRVIAIIDRIGKDIVFTYDSSSAKSILSGGGGGTTVDPGYLKGGAIAGMDGLSTDKVKTFGGDSSVRKAFPESELSIFSRLIPAIFSKLGLMANSINSFQTENKETNYTRRKLRFNFLGKLIIQPMDVVHIYMSSKSRYDTRLMSGLNNMFTGLGFFQNLNNSAVDLKNSWNNLFNPSESVSLQAEKSAMVGPEFPNFLWSMMRGQFISEKEGVHVFAGLVNSATDHWSAGKYTVNIECSDQSKYFEMGKVNFNPGCDVFNGSIYDPLTPYKSNFDSIISNVKEHPPLLDENQWLLSTDKKSPLVRFNNGTTVGEPVTQSNISQDKSVDPNSGILSQTIYEPDGLVHKWKQGIGVLVQFGSSNEINGPNTVGSVNVNKYPFAGQDVMNVISLLITGFPYNFATYYKSFSSGTGIGRNPTTQQDASSTFSDSLANSLKKNNILWGNFIPFKSLTVSDKSYSKLQLQFNIGNQNSDFDSKLKKIIDQKDKMSFFNMTDSLKNPDIKKQTDSNKKAEEIILNELRIDIQGMIDKYNENSKDFIVVGDDVTFNDNESSELNNNKNGLTNPNIRRLLRRQVNSLTRRMSYNVKANEDKNLFIVDDYYDKDFDIAAYNRAFTDGLKLYNNEFLSVKENITSVAKLLNLEVFCDTQGHIRIRPPQYNRMPTSVFYKMMYLKKSLQVQIFPQFLENIFEDNIDALKEKLEIIEDQIRLNCAALDYNTDEDAQYFIRGQTPKALLGTQTQFYFVSNEDGNIVGNTKLIISLFNDDSNEEQISNSNSLENSLKKLKGQATSIVSTFNASSRADFILKNLIDKKLSDDGFSINNINLFKENPRINDLIDRIQNRTGQKISKENFIKTVTNNYAKQTTSNLDIFKITQELYGYISERQKVIRSLYFAIKNLKEFRYLDDNPNSANKLLSPGSFGSSEIPEVYEHMLEDESYDDLGLGSGSRYIIRRPQIIDMSFSENQPPYTQVEVHGVQNDMNPDALPPGFQTFPKGGNAIVTAMALDYDMWRNYGLTNSSPIIVPFLSNPNTQCAPYASMLLSQARKKILTGSITISGNEYMQPGEVVFIEDRGLLFYINSVSHNFTYGSNFKTTLQLTYGHAPGEYIPTVMDVIGKMIVINKDVSNLIIYRESSSFNDRSLGVIQLNPKNTADYAQSISQGQQNRYSNDNTQIIRNILFSVAQFIQTNNISSSNVRAKIELRIYYDDNNVVEDSINKFASYIKTVLTDKRDAGAALTVKNGSKKTKITLEANDVKDPIAINMHKKGRSPSQAAFTAVRAMMESMRTSSTSINKKDKMRDILFKYVVDCWLVMEQVK